MMRCSYAVVLILLLFSASCRKDEEPDAYGNVEAVDVVVSAEASGRLETFKVLDGAQLAAGEIVGMIETNVLQHQQREITAQRAASFSRIDEIGQQIAALEVQRRIAGRAYERTRRLFQQNAATAQQLDQTERDYRVLGEQIDAARLQQNSIRRETEAGDARVAAVSERIAKGAIHNPIAGTVLATYAEEGELTQIGQPLYRIADLRNVEVRAYVSETQLAALRIGQPAAVTIDRGEKQRAVINGRVTWISPDSEFTPTPIQTREERADLVYAVKIRVPNPNGILKIGMPADVDFPSSPSSP